MKNWQETAQIFEEMSRLQAQGRAFVLAVITRIQGSGYRRPGAKLLVRDDGTLIGNVSGGCLENDLRERALQMMRSGVPGKVHYDTGTDDDRVWGFGLGCNGQIDLWLCSSSSPKLAAILGAVCARLAGDEPFGIRMRLAVERDAESFELIERPAGAAVALAEQAGVEVFTDALTPPPWLVVCGAGDDAVPLVALAAAVGFRVVVVDHRPAYLKPERFPAARLTLCARPEDSLPLLPANARTFVVIKTHILEHDRAWFARFAATPAPYIGLLGPKARRVDVLKSATPEQAARAYGPVGLDIGAEGAEQVAVSVVAELLCVYHGRRPQHLRDRTQPIHA